jgi:hypothetical protein
MKLMMSKKDRINSFGKRAIKANVHNFRTKIRSMLRKGQYDELPKQVYIGYRD